MDAVPADRDHAGMASNTPNRIRELRERAGLSQEKLAERLNTSQPQVLRLETGQRRLTIDWAKRIARAVGVDWRELDSPAPAPDARHPETPPGFIEVPVLGRVAAGLFSDSDSLDDGLGRIAVPAGAKARQAGRFAVRVEGPSMNQLYPDGSLLDCQSIDAVGREPRPGERWIVRRRTVDGRFEFTVKEYAVDRDGKRWLVPRSDEPAFRDPVALPGRAGPGAARRGARMKGGKAGAAERFDFVARVVGSYRSE